MTDDRTAPARRSLDAAVFAAGDVARFPNPALGVRIRVEHEDNANRMGWEAGRAMAGADVVDRHLPFFYSDLTLLPRSRIHIIETREDRTLGRLAVELQGTERLRRSAKTRALRSAHAARSHT